MDENKKLWMLGGLLAVLGLMYVFFFTDWLAPVPMEIASQVRPVIQQPRFGRRVNTAKPGTPNAKGDMVVRRDGGPAEAAATEVRVETTRQEIPEPANGVAHVTFSLDGRYSLTSIRVFAINPDGERGKMVWDVTGSSRSLNSLIYGMVPAGMTAAGDGTAQPLEAGMKYRLEAAAGRRKGTNVFQTITRPAPTE